jgi:hypothetical protein
MPGTPRRPPAFPTSRRRASTAARRGTVSRRRGRINPHPHRRLVFVEHHVVGARSMRSLASNATDHGQGIARNGVAMPGDMLVRADEDQVALIEASGVRVADVDHVERHGTVGARVHDRRDVDVGETQQGKSLAEQVEDCATVFQEKGSAPAFRARFPACSCARSGLGRFRIRAKLPVRCRSGNRTRCHPPRFPGAEIEDLPGETPAAVLAVLPSSWTALR